MLITADMFRYTDRAGISNQLSAHAGDQKSRPLDYQHTNQLTI